MLQDEYDAIDAKIHDLKDQRGDFEEKLKHNSDEVDEIEYKFQIIKINEKIQTLESKQYSLREQIKEENQRDFLYKKLYVSDDLLGSLSQIYNIKQNSKDNTINYLINNYPIDQIFEVIDLFESSSSSERSDFIKTIQTKNSSVEDLLESHYESEVEDIIRTVENNGFKFNGTDGYEIAFLKDFSNEVNFESFLLSEFEDDVEMLVGDIMLENYRNENGKVVYWTDIPEYDKLMLLPVDTFIERYEYYLGEQLDNLINDDIKTIHDFYCIVKIKTPKNTNPIFMQTTEYQRKYQRIKQQFIKSKSKKFKNRNGMLYIDGWNSKLTIEDCYELIFFIDSNGEWPSILELLKKFPNVSSKYYEILAENYNEFLEFLGK